MGREVAGRCGWGEETSSLSWGRASAEVGPDFPNDEMYYDGSHPLNHLKNKLQVEGGIGALQTNAAYLEEQLCKWICFFF